MTEQKSKRPRFRFVLRRSKPLTTIVVVSAVVLCLLTIFVLKVQVAETNGKLDHLRAEAAALENDHSRLELYIREMGTVQGVILMAREKLGLVSPDTVILSPGR